MTISYRHNAIPAARAAVTAPDLAPAVVFAQNRPEQRDFLREQLAFFAQSLAIEGREKVASEPLAAERAARRHGIVLTALGEVEKNVQPGLALESMCARLRRV